jgi:hypothetical protein
MRPLGSLGDHARRCGGLESLLLRWAPIKAEMIAMPVARLHDASTIAVEIHGDGPTVLLPVNPQPIQGAQTEELRRWGADPALAAP